MTICILLISNVGIIIFLYSLASKTPVEKGVVLRGAEFIMNDCVGFIYWAVC
jgi:hypothetical protein